MQEMTTHILLLYHGGKWLLDPQAPREGDKDPAADAQACAENDEDAEDNAAVTQSEDETEWDRWSTVRLLFTFPSIILLTPSVNGICSKIMIL